MPTTTASGMSSSSSAKVAVKEAVGEAVHALDGAKPSFGLLFATPRMELREVLREAERTCPGTQFVGCTTAGEITERGLMHGGLATMLVSTDEQKHEIQAADARQPEQASQELSRTVLSNLRGGVGTTVLLVDGLSGTGEALVDGLRRETGGALHEIVGGAAGDEGGFQATWVGCGGRVHTGGAIALHVFGPHRWGIGVDHGLTPATPAMRVTKAKGNFVLELDGRRAFDVYRDYAADQGKTLRAEDASSFLINNELGIMVFDQLRKARAPLSVSKEGGLSCAAEIPQGAYVCILGGNRDELVAAAKRAAAEAKTRLGTRKAAGVLLFDCICRGAILGDTFTREVEAVRDVFPEVPIAGFLTYGEIARYSGRLDGWHNTTAVVAAIPA